MAVRVYATLKMDKTETQAIIKYLQKKDMTHAETVALDCYSIFLIHQLQSGLTFICSLNSNHTVLIASLQTIRVVEEYLGDHDATFFHEGLQCSNIAGSSLLM